MLFRSLYKGAGCPMCFHTGYRGRVGVFEVLLIDHTLRGMITRQLPREEILEAAARGGFQTLAQHCQELVLAGITSAEEAARTINSTLD